MSGSPSARGAVLPSAPGQAPPRASTGLLADGVVVDHGGGRVLDGATIEVAAGECVAVRGPSGSGKTTLLHVIAGLLVPDAGEVALGGRRIGGSERARAAVRLEQVGMVFQHGELLPELTVRENVELPLRLRGRRDPERASDLLESVGLAHRLDARPETLSGGEVQRAAIARALVGSPAVVLADEPTGALDEQLSRTVVQLLVERAHHLQVALLVATHDPLVAEHVDRRVLLHQGRVVHDR